MSESLDRSSFPPRSRRIFCNRTLNLGAIRAIGYDMDYTLIDYHVREWELRAYEHLRAKLLARGWPVQELRFDPDLVIRGLVIDTELGNALKTNRFGYVKKAFHGRRALDFQEQRRLYGRTIVDLGEDRYVFLNTLFSLSEGCMYLQLVDLRDAGRLPEAPGYDDLHAIVRSDIDAAHLEGELKGEICNRPEAFVKRDPDAPRALLDQKIAGKRLMLITNSDWDYTRRMMTFAFDPFLPGDLGWRDLFELVIVSARKPDFFSARNPMFEVVDDGGLLSPCTGPPRRSGIYLGGNADLVEEYLALSGDEILYVGDHVYADIHISKNVRRWRTALILGELEEEIAALDAFRPHQRELEALMQEKEELEFQFNRARMLRQRAAAGLPSDGDAGDPTPYEAQAEKLHGRLLALDERIAPLARAATVVANANWGTMMRAGNDKSLFARQVESYADVYTSRVSNFLHHTPYAFFRSLPGRLPHDPE